MKTVVWCICGSFCTIPANLEIMRSLADKYSIIPVLSEKAASCDTRFTNAARLIAEVEEICGRKAILTVTDAEPLGPKLMPDLCLIAPTTGNTLAKLSHAITDGAVTMAAKSVMRNGRPLLLSLATNDALGANLENIGRMAARRGCFFVPMRQDDPIAKPYSLVADTAQLADAVEAAMAGRQLRPLFL